MLNPEKINCPLSLVVILYHTSSKALVLALSVDCYSFPASSDSPQLLPSAQPSAPAVTDSVQDPEVGAAGPRRASVQSQELPGGAPDDRKR